MIYAYGILCHQITNPLRYTLNKLSLEQNVLVYIHIDAKTDINIFLEEFSLLDNIHFISDRYDVQWGSISQVYATLALLKTAIKQPFKYFSLLSGDDIPLQPISSFHHYLQVKPYEYIDLEAHPDHRLENRIKYKYSPAFFNKHPTFSERLNKKWNKRLFKLGFNKVDVSHLPPLYKGSQWFTLSFEAISYILKYLDNNEKYLITFEHSLCGDELFFHTILFNSPLLNTIKTKNRKSESYLRYIDWFSGPDFPKTLTEQDFQKMKSTNLFFARKVEKNISYDALEYFN